MSEQTRQILQAALARREAAGLNVRATVFGRTSELSFATVESRDDFLRRVEANP